MGQVPELYFKDKEIVRERHRTVPCRPLCPDAARSLGAPDLSGSLVIQGDNLHALKALIPQYAGRVDCIAIDPPYNTGSELWSYHDHASHDRWLAMMYPRLVLLRELLADDGLIAVTIDDHELDHLLLTMNEIFGPENRLACAVWLSDPSGGKHKTALRVGHEYIVIYGGGSADLTREEKTGAALGLADRFGVYAKGRELHKWGSNSLRSDRPSMFFPLTAPDGTEVWPIRSDGQEGCWRYGRKSRLMRDLLAEPDRAHWEKRPANDGGRRWVPYEKIRDTQRAFGWRTWLDDIGTNADGSRTLKEIFGRKVFETPKPVALMEWILGLSAKRDGVVLDSFAGSGTTAHAALSLNRKDGGNRRFLLVECEDYADSVTAERVRRVIQGYESAGKQVEGLGGGFTFCTLGEE
jgi:adenine-specific DNA-methyltransferase